MKEYNSVSWFEVREESVHIRAIRWTGAIVAAILLNLLYIRILPSGVQIARIAESTIPAEDMLEIEMVEPDDPFQYVETNPDNVQNEPDDTTNISDQNQQAAQENVAGAENNPTPFLKGDDQESPKIVEGHMPVEEESGSPIQVYGGGQQTIQGQQQQAVTQPKQEAQPESKPSIAAPAIYDLPEIAPPPPTPEFIDKEESDSDEGVSIPIIEKPQFEAEEQSQQEGKDKHININIPPSVAQELSKAIEEQKALQQQQALPNQQAGQNSAQPMPRPRLSPKVLPGPLLDSQIYAARMGPIGFDAKFSQFGYYLSRMFETIQMQWYSLLTDVKIGQEHRPAYVIIRYALDSQGKVVHSEVLETNAGQLATLLCRDAIESRAPFGPWTEQMVEQLGDQTEIVLKFIYM